jgi:choline dehydrogenase
MTASTALGSYDYVVVGAGSGGSVVARRLLDAGATVAVLEAGGPATNPAIHDPGRWDELGLSDCDWGYYTDPQEACAGRRLHWPRGKVVGGSGAINGMAYIRGHRLDYDGWAYHGCPGWSYEDVLPIFKRSEDFDLGESEFHGSGGPFRVITQYEPHPLNAAMVAASQEAGIAFNPDHNGAELEGVGYTQLTIRDGVRETGATAFLDPVASSPDLTVYTGARARRLRFSGSRCTGVEIARDGEPGVVEARAEVVVSCGTIDSPKLLMLSGIGPAEELAGLGIAVLVDLPGVGRNLHDHLLSPVLFSSPKPIPPRLPGLTQFHSQLFWRSRPGLVVPDTEPLCFHIPLVDPEWIEVPTDGYTIFGGLIRPESRGSIRLGSADPEVPLSINPRCLSCDADVEALAASVELCREIGRQEALSEWTAAELFPGPEVRTPDEVREHVRRTAVSYHHQVGTCRMGQDARAVVDPELRVHGVEGLRVADASVMPAVTTGNTNAPTMMIGEKASDALLARNGG